MLTVFKVPKTDLPSYQNFTEAGEASFLQSREWGLWQLSLGRESFQYIVKDTEIVLSAQLLRHSLPLGKYYLYCPYGPVVDVKFKNQSEKATEALTVLLKQLKTDFPDCLFVKLEPASDLALDQIFHRGQGFGGQANIKCQTSSRIQPGSTLLLDLTKTLEQLLSEMHAKHRYNIRLAERHGVIVKSGLLELTSTTDQLIELICNTTERQSYSGHPKSYYKNFVQFFSQYNEDPNFKLKARWYGAFLENQMLSGAIFLDYGQTRDFLFGGSSAEHKEAMPSFLMQWQSIQDAKAKGLTVYDLGGTETSSGKIPGFVKFKLRFGGKQVHYPNARDFTWHHLHYKLYRFAKKLIK